MVAKNNAPEYLDAYTEFLPDLTLKGGAEYRARCPFHKDNDPSLHVNVEKGVFHCKGCGASGNLVMFVAMLKGVSIHAAKQLYPNVLAPENVIHPQTVEDHHQVLLGNQQVLRHLEDSRGIPEDWVRLLRLGLHENRIAIPVYNEAWWIIDVKYHALERGVEPKVTHARGFGGNYAFPMQLNRDTSKPAVVVEGELDALMMRVRGFDAYTSTGGVASLEVCDELLKVVAEHERTYVCLDIDAVGREKAGKLVGALNKRGCTARNILLPLTPAKYPHGDVTDYFVKEGYGAQDFNNLMLAADRTDEDDEAERVVFDTTVSTASRAQYWNERVKFKAMVVAKGIHPYFVPRRASITCAQGHKICMGCPVVGNPMLELEHDDPRLIEFVGASKTKTAKLVREAMAVPPSCRYSTVTVLEMVNVQEVIVTGTFQSLVSNEEIDVTRRCLFLGHDVHSNNIYHMTADVVADPSSSEVLYVVTAIEPDVDDISNAEVTDEDKQVVSVFRPDDDTAAGVRAKLDDVYEDLAVNVTRIFGRKRLHQVVDLGYHSVLCFSWEDEKKVYKGLTEMLVIGDSGQGKSEVIESLRTHYGRGEKLDCKSATYAGLIGGLEDMGSKRFMVWGRIPQNDRGAVILDEVKGMHTELIAQLTDVRSSNVAVVTRVGGARRASARVRYFWLSNPRSKMRIDEYGYGVMAVQDLIGAQEDIRRFDAATTVSTGEVAQKYIDDMIKAPPTIEHKYTAEACRTLIRLVWSRTRNVVPVEVKRYIVDRATELSSRYSVDIPLLEPADARLKVARLSLAVAARVASFTEDWSSVRVEKHHVDVAVEFLDELYSEPRFAFNVWSNEHRKSQAAEKTTDDEVVAEITSLPAPDEFVSIMLSTNFIPRDLFEAACGLEFVEAKRLAGMLLSKQYITQFRTSYRKTPKFIVLLKRLQNDESLVTVRREEF